MCKRVLRVRRRVHGDVHADVAVALNALGRALWKKGELDLAMAKYEEAREIFAGLYGEDHKDVFVVLANMAVVLGEKGRVEEQLAINEKIVDMERRSSGADSHSFATSLCNLGGSYNEVGMLEKALVVFEEGLGIVRRIHPEKNSLEDFRGSSRMRLRCTRRRVGSIAVHAVQRVRRCKLSPTAWLRCSWRKARMRRRMKRWRRRLESIGGWRGMSMQICWI
mmetsp:Transcript_61261/g.147456  ORF Transcript_61261/g.147456 Transcript_61261/m.147456 type:complete len:222 (+) Transcript_61261:397-1062(+)